MSEQRRLQLEAIASPQRLSLFTLLSEPRTLEEIEAATAMAEGEVEDHLHDLQAAGLVVDHRVEAQTRSLERYVADLRCVHELGQALRGLCFAYGPRSDGEGCPPTWEPASRSDPCLVGIRGVSLGRSFVLEPKPEGTRRGWIIGRGDHADVSLDGDPYVEPRAGAIEPSEEGFQFADLRTAKQRVSWNGQPLQRGASQPLADGDLVGVGRSLLRFRT